jgi:long-chain acyl-CoA synthetase
MAHLQESTAAEGPVNEKAEAAVRAILARLARRPIDAIEPAMHLHLDLGIDSIGKIDALGMIEACFAMRIDNEAGAKIARVADLFRVIGPREPKTATAFVGDAVWQRRLERETDGNGAAPGQKLTGALVPMRWLLRSGVAAFMNSYVRVRASGQANIPPTGGFILAPNHSSHLDTPSVMTAVGDRRRVWVAGAEDYFFATPVKRLVFGKLLDTIPFDRRSDGLGGLRRCSEALRRGDGLLIYPEGTRSLTGELQSFKTGVAVLAIERGVPIIPVCIDRTFELLPKGKRFARPGTVIVRFGKPIQPPSREQITDFYAAFQELTHRLEKAITAMANRIHTTGPHS